LIFVGGEKDVIQPEEKPVNEHSEGPDDNKKRQEDDAFFGETGCGIF
jgi:hypothetical protein